MRVRGVLAAAAILTLLAPIATVPAQAQTGSNQIDAGPRLGIDTDCDELTCTFTAVNADEAVNGSVETYNWTIVETGDDGDGPVFNNTFDHPGTHNVTLGVTGDNDTAQHTETVNPQANRVDQSTVPWRALALGTLALAGSLVLARAT
jgi:hypothetical protein